MNISDLAPGNYTVDEIMNKLDIKFKSKKIFGQYMKKLGYTSHPKRINSKPQRVYTIGSLKHLVLKQLYQLTKEKGNGSYSIDSIRNWLTVKFGSNKEFGIFMKSLGYSSYVTKYGHREYCLAHEKIYPVSRTDRTTELKERGQLWIVEDDKLYPANWVRNA
jgi:hypothetical protein